MRYGASVKKARVDQAVVGQNKPENRGWMPSDLVPDAFQRAQTDNNCRPNTVWALSSRQYNGNPQNSDAGGQLKMDFGSRNTWNMDLKPIPLRPSTRMSQDHNQPAFEPFGASGRYSTPPSCSQVDENCSSLLGNTIQMLTGKSSRLDTCVEAPPKSADVGLLQQPPMPVEPRPNALQQIHPGSNVEYQGRKSEISAAQQQPLGAFRLETPAQQYGNMDWLEASDQPQQFFQINEYDYSHHYASGQHLQQSQQLASTLGAIGEGRSCATSFYGNKNNNDLNDNNGVPETVTVRKKRSQDAQPHTFGNPSSIWSSMPLDPLYTADSAIPQEYKTGVPQWPAFEADQFGNSQINKVQKPQSAQDIHLLASSGLFSLENMALEPIHVPLSPPQGQGLKMDLKQAHRLHVGQGVAPSSSDDGSGGCSAACIKKMKNLETTIYFYKQQIESTNGMRGKEGEEKVKLRKEIKDYKQKNAVFFHKINELNQEMENIRQFAEAKHREALAARDEIIDLKWDLVIEATKGTTKTDDYFRDEFAMLFRGLQGWATRYLKFPNEIPIPPPTRGWLHEICGGEEHEYLINSSKTKAFIVVAFMIRLFKNYIFSDNFNEMIIRQVEMEGFKDRTSVVDILDQNVSKQCESIGKDLFTFIYSLISRPYDSVLIDQCQKNLISLVQQAGCLQIELRKVEKDRVWDMTFPECRSPFSSDSMQCVDCTTLGEASYGEQQFKEKVGQGRAFVKSCSIPTLTRSIKEKDGSVKPENTIVIQKAEVLLL